jgi:phosphoglycolate phosphatase-like HAD superfamily hydrolase
MQGLQTLVREFGFISEDHVLSAAQYKSIFLNDLIKTVNVRMAQLQRGELAVTDFVVKNAVQLLTQLHEMGITLYLASGTDEQDVIREAEALGYATLFTGGIFGASGDMDREAKRMVMERILREAGNAKMAVFGDGPVEIREGRRKGALTVGVASDEVRRFGLNRHKRTRLIRAGAHGIVPDFSQVKDLIDFLKY